MQTTKISHIAHLVEICVQHGITQVVVSPGSRNAPLIIAFDAHPSIEIILIHDERSAAFFALGLAEASGKTVALTCTSGSAPLNYAPGIVEAYYRNIPLLILTADRPAELVDQGDGQTIRQKNLYANYIKAQYELPNQPKKEDVSSADNIVNKAILEASNFPKGPVHINIPLAEPLYETTTLETLPVFTSNENDNAIGLTDEEKLLIESGWLKSERKLILIGQLTSGSDLKDLLIATANDPSVAILVENTSNIQNFQKFCHSIDRALAIISPEDIPAFAPDLLISMGGAIVSKRIKAFFRMHKPKINWRVGIFNFEEDTYQSLKHSFKCSPNKFLRFVNGLETVPMSNFGNKWKQADLLSNEKHDDFISTAPFSDLTAIADVLETLPVNVNLHMSNSSVVRYCQLFNPLLGVNYYCNRGVSGIDGSTSTAVGFAHADKERLNVIISGDLSFMYDSNALWNNYLDKNIKIVVINNNGGGIFKIIDGPSKSDQRELFVAPIETNIQGICNTFNINYFKADSKEVLLDVIDSFYIEKNNRPSVLEIKTAEIPSDQILKQYFKGFS